LLKTVVGASPIFFGPRIPDFLSRSVAVGNFMRLSLRESRMSLLNAATLDRKSGIRGPKKMGEAQSKVYLFPLPLKNRHLKRAGRPQ
jgi:hypothetical protein